MNAEYFKINHLYRAKISGRQNHGLLIFKHFGSFGHILYITPLAAHEEPHYVGGIAFIYTTDIHKCTEIKANDLPLYLNLPIIYPAFKEILNGN